MKVPVVDKPAFVTKAELIMLHVLVSKHIWTYVNGPCMCIILQECVKRKALMSVLAVRNVELEHAKSIVEKVFEKCYNDREPFGRVMRRRSSDPQRMLSEGFLYGYSDSR